MQIFFAEMIGSMFLLTIGFSSIAVDVLHMSWGKGSGWLMQGFAWGVGLAMGLLAAIALGSQGHVNPMVTIAFIVAGIFPLADAPIYFAGQIAGGLLSGVLVWLLYLPHWAATEDQQLKLACFAMGPAVRKPLANLLAEGLSFFIFVVGIFVILKTVFPLGFVPGCLATGLWLSAAFCATGGQIGCGYGIDLFTRLAHQLLPIAGKGPSDWRYAWVPLLGPALGAIAAALVSRAVGFI